jgi:hypothetical protein
LSSVTPSAIIKYLTDSPSATASEVGFSPEFTRLKTSSACQKKRALRRFRQACGLGKVEKSSGQVKAGSGGGNWTGCANTRSTLWTYVNCRIEPQKLKGQAYTAVQLELREYFVGRAFNAADGTKKRGGRLADARNATCRKLADLVFRELYNMK